MDPKSRPTILCVDDEPAILSGLTLQLERRFNLLTAGSGAEGLAVLGREPQTSVVISDMRMPNMDGASFLTHVRELLPDSVRILLTGQADLKSAIAAVNGGQIFRFLTKPCPPKELLAAVEAAVKQHELVISERVLLEQTLHGSVKALSDVLALTSPALFGRATRIKRRVAELAAALQMRERWQVEVAAMLSQLGALVLPPETAARVYGGKELSEADQTMVARGPAVIEQLLESIPRLEVVRGMLQLSMKPRRTLTNPTPEEALATQGAEILRLASDFDLLETRGTTLEMTLATLRGRTERYDPAILATFLALLATTSDTKAPLEVRELLVPDLRVGMVFAEDILMSAGALLVARGFEISSSFIERARNFPRGAIKEPMRVFVRSS